MTLVELNSKCQTLCNEGFSLYEVDDVEGHEIVDVKVGEHGKVMLITKKIEQK